MSAFMRLFWIAALSLTGCATGSNLSTGDAGVPVIAVVKSWEASVQWDHFEDGSFETRDAMTLTIITPPACAGRMLRVMVDPGAVPNHSPLRVAGTRLSFRIDPARLNDDPVFSGALQDPVIIP